MVVVEWVGTLWLIDSIMRTPVSKVFQNIREFSSLYQIQLPDFTFELYATHWTLSIVDYSMLTERTFDSLPRFQFLWPTEQKFDEFICYYLFVKRLQRRIHTNLCKKVWLILICKPNDPIRLNRKSIFILTKVNFHGRNSSWIKRFHFR